MGHGVHRVQRSSNIFLFLHVYTGECAVLMWDKLFALMCYCTEPSNLLDQVCSTLCTDRLRVLDITMLFQFRVSVVTRNDLLFYPLGSSLESLVYRNKQGWVSKSVRMTLKAVAMQPRESAPCCDLPGDPVFLALQAKITGSELTLHLQKQKIYI